MTPLPCGGRKSRHDILLQASRHPLAALAARGLDDAAVTERDPLVLAVSGGGDSMAMLCVVAAVRARTDPSLSSLTLVAIDHGVRPENAQEAMLAVEAARGLGLADARAIRVRVSRDGNLLDAARHARLAALGAVARELGARHIALAHQADDRAEGLVLGLSRGGGLDGMASIRPRRELDDGTILVRPLLRARRADLRGFLREIECPWSDDPTNGLRARGAMRADPSVAALLDRIAAGAGLALDEAAALANLRDGIAASLVPDGATSLTRSDFDAAPSVVRAAVIQRLARHAGAAVPRAALDQSARISRDDRAPRSFDCGDGRVLRIDAHAVTVG